MITKTACLFLMSVGLCGAAHGGIYDNSYAGVRVMGSAPWKFESRSGPQIFDCAGGPGTAILTATEYGFFQSVDSGLFEDYPYIVDVARRIDFQNVAGGMSLGRRPSIENAGDFHSFYVGFSCDLDEGTGGSPLFKMDLQGNIQVVVPVEELRSVNPDGCSGIREIGVGPGDLLFLGLAGNSSKDRLLVKVDLSGEPGARVTPVLDSAGILEQLPELEDSEVNTVNWGLNFAVDDQARVFLPVDLVLDGPEGEYQAHAIIRLDPDGTITELTGREHGGGQLSDSHYAQARPATCSQGGLEYDPVTGLLVGVGYGIWLLNPDRSEANSIIVGPEQIHSMAWDLVGDDWGNRPDMAAAGGGTCLARTESGFYGAFMYTYLLFDFDPGYLDLDKDELDGRGEAAAGTDPWNPDSDGGGTFDGLELLDLTDPSTGSDDRFSDEVPDGYQLVDRYTDSKYGRDVGEAGLARHGAALWDGTLLLGRGPGSGQDKLEVFKDYGLGVSKTQISGSEWPVSVDHLGNAVQMVTGTSPNTWVVQVTTPQGNTSLVADTQELQALLGPQPVPTAWAREPSGRVWMGFRGGKLLRKAPDSALELFYDAHQELVDAGVLDENDMVPGSACSGGVEVEVMAFEPRRSILYLGLNQYYYCSGVQFAAPVIAAILPDDRIVRVGNTLDFPKSTLSWGAGSFTDLEPDWRGGFFLLFAHGLNRTIVHYDANWRAQEVGNFLAPGFSPKGKVQALNYANEILARPDGRNFLLMGRAWKEVQVRYRLGELLPVFRRVIAGQLVFVHPEAGHLAVMDETGAGTGLLEGKPLQIPVGVAATDAAVAISDAGLKKVILFPLGENGRLGEPRLIGNLMGPAGLDIDLDGNVVAVDTAQDKVVRIKPDGTQEDLLVGGPLRSPGDVVVTSGGIVVANTGADEVGLLTPDLEYRVLAGVPQPISVAVSSGNFLAVSSRDPSSPVVLVDGEGNLREPADPVTARVQVEFLIPGGVALSDQGSLFTARAQDPVSGGDLHSFVAALGPDGKPRLLLDEVMAATKLGLDLAWVRPAAILPDLPVGPFPVLSPVEPGDQGDVSFPEPGDAGSRGPADEDPARGKGGCSAAADRASPASSAILLLLPLLLVLLRLRKLLPVLLVLVLAGCSGGDGADKDRGGGDRSGQDANVAPDQSGRDTTLLPDQAGGPDCPGRDQCAWPGQAECVDSATLRRCLLEPDGCFVWTEPAACPQGGVCSDGACRTCIPTCDPLQECGDDGCGGSCGQCRAPDSCCGDFFCGDCRSDCTNRECGNDGMGGYCGACGEAQVCVAGQCKPREHGRCPDLFPCLGDCASWDLECAEQCEGYLTVQSNQTAAAYLACTGLYCDQCRDDDADCFDDCVFSMCPEEFSECWAQGGTYDCRDLYTCAFQCSPDDQDCLNSCYFGAFPTSLTLAIELEVCLSEYCPVLPPNPEGWTCFHEAGMGPCHDFLVDCLGNCNDSCEGIECGLNDCLMRCGCDQD